MSVGAGTPAAPTASYLLRDRTGKRKISGTDGPKEATLSSHRHHGGQRDLVCLGADAGLREEPRARADTHTHAHALSVTGAFAPASPAPPTSLSYRRVRFSWSLSGLSKTTENARAGRPPRGLGPGHRPPSAWIEGGAWEPVRPCRDWGRGGHTRPTQCASPPRPLRARLPVLHREVSDETDEKNPLHISRFYFLQRNLITS